MSTLTPIPQRQVGRRSLNLSHLSFGAAPIGKLYQPLSEQQGERAVMSAVAAGIHYSETALHCGVGLSESRLGAALTQGSCTDPWCGSSRSFSQFATPGCTHFQLISEVLSNE